MFSRESVNYVTDLRAPITKNEIKLLFEHDWMPADKVRGAYLKYDGSDYACYILGRIMTDEHAILVIRISTEVLQPIGHKVTIISEHDKVHTGIAECLHSESDNNLGLMEIALDDEH